MVFGLDRSINSLSSLVIINRFGLFFDVCNGETVAIGFVKRAVAGFAIDPAALAMVAAVGGDDGLLIGVDGSSDDRSLFAS